jgi:CubicO group peptidase (beta-lactamase class C family)
MPCLKIIGLFFVSWLVFNCGNIENKKVKKEQKIIDVAKIRKEIKADKKEKLIASFIDQKILEGFNGNVLVAQKDIILFEKSVGFAVFEDTIKNTKETKFQLASLSKTFTAVATMKLVEDGKIGLDNTIKDYYPNFPYEGVSIRSLLSHRSGLPYYQYELDKKVRSEKFYPSNQQMMEWFISANPTPKVLNKPDHFFSYNNTNFAILAAIIEKVSGQSFDTYLRKNILEPSGMNNTFDANTLSPKINVNRSFGYQNGRRLEKDYYDNISGDKGIYSTTEDLFKWYQTLKSETILSKESLREMYTPRSFEHPGLRNYGLGFRLWVNNLQQTDYIYHTGWWKGYNTILFFDLREDFVIILLSNRYNRSVYNIKGLVDILHGNDNSSNIEDNILDI